jgi:hypothetical protein
VLYASSTKVSVVSIDHFEALFEHLVEVDDLIPERSIVIKLR